MKKVYLFLTAMCLAALTGCIKEGVELTEANVSMSISTRVDLNSSSNEQGDAIGDINVWAFACDEDGKVSDSSDTAVAWRCISAANTHTSVDVHLQFTTCDDDADHYYKLVAVINQAEFGAVSGISSFGRDTKYSELAGATFVANDLMAKMPGNGAGSTPGKMPISHWTIIKLNKDNNGSTHADCVEVTMPVYRAVAKAQLFMAKTTNDFTLKVTEAKLTCQNLPINGVLLSALTREALESANPTPAWFGSVIPTYESREGWPRVHQLKYNDSSINDTDNIVEVTSYGKTDKGENNYQFVGSSFMYETTEVCTQINNTYDTESVSKDTGYYLEIHYDIEGDKGYQKYVAIPYAVVRNHDYQICALVDAGGKLELTLNVKEWNDVTESWEYTDVATLAENGKLTWSNTTTVSDLKTQYKTDADGKPTEELDYYYKLVTVTNTNTNSAEGTFFIQTPAGATWQAMFASGDINSFEFVDAEGNSLGNTTSGNVGEQATLRIRAKKAATDISRAQEAFLDIVVRTSDGRIIKVNNLMTDNNGQEIKYKIVQDK